MGFKEILLGGFTIFLVISIIKLLWITLQPAFRNSKSLTEKERRRSQVIVEAITVASGVKEPGDINLKNDEEKRLYEKMFLEAKNSPSLKTKRKQNLSLSEFEKRMSELKHDQSNNRFNLFKGMLPILVVLIGIACLFVYVLVNNML